MDNCTTTTMSSGWHISALVIEMIVCVFGAIGNGFSLYCLLNCKKVQGGMKIHLCLLFSMCLAICSLALPPYIVVEHGKMLGWYIHKETIKVFLAWYTVPATLDRNVHAVLAVYRMVAVLFPFRYKAISRKAVSLVVEGTVCVSVTTLWIIAFSLRKDPFACETDTSSSDFGYILYIFLVPPHLITVIAYIAMILSMASKKRNIAEFMNQIRGEEDQPTTSVTILILTNIVVDVPHIILHLESIRPGNFSYIVIHIIYRLHFALDPFIFIGFNRRYRQMVICKILSMVQVTNVSDSPHGFREAVSDATQV